MKYRDLLTHDLKAIPDNELRADRDNYHVYLGSPELQTKDLTPEDVKDELRIIELEIFSRL